VSKAHLLADDPIPRCAYSLCVCSSSRSRER